MEKSMPLNLRINPAVKQQAEDVLKKLGIPMATAVDMFLRQVSLTGGIPFLVTLPKVTTEIDNNTFLIDQISSTAQTATNNCENI